MARYDSYVICTSPRSGSTLLCDLLAATGVAGNPGSHFHDPSISEWLGYYDLDPEPGLAEHEVLAQIFREAVRYGTQHTGMFGLRLQRHSFAFFQEKLDLLHPGFASDVERFGAAFGKTLFIHLTRRHKVEQAVSYVKASQTGLWHQAPDGTELERLSPPRAPEFDAEAIAAQVEEFIRYDEEWEQWFAAESIECVRLTYDALSADPAGTLKTVLQALDLDIGAADGIEPGVAKLADETSRNWVTRFRALSRDTAGNAPSN
ncbi:MAG: Stf0 family sulfotransferase [Pseudomonadota bacterium]